MKVLWFNVTLPSRFKKDGPVVGGWQDSLENIVRSVPGIELTIAFETRDDSERKRNIDGVCYYPICVHFSCIEKIKDLYSWDVHAKKMLEGALKVVADVSPDVVHIFGTEWPWGLVAEYVRIPVVIHIQGALVPYMNAFYPPGYSFEKEILKNCYNPKRIIGIICRHLKRRSWERLERKTWSCVSNYMGRTCWDKAITEAMHPGASYFHVDEAIRPFFFNSSKCWKGYEGGKVKLISTGCSSFWKGPDMLLKTAHALKKMGVCFEWKVVGNIPENILKFVEKTEKMSFEDNNVSFLGFVGPEVLVEELCESSIYIHTAYIENSPNSICEAQLIGLPIVCTHVGGIETLLQDAGVLVPANDPWRMAYEIKLLQNDLNRMFDFSSKSKKIALARHNPDAIVKQLKACYDSVIFEKK